jgi:hypothetical protein
MTVFAGILSTAAALALIATLWFRSPPSPQRDHFIIVIGMCLAFGWGVYLF